MLIELALVFLLQEDRSELLKPILEKHKLPGMVAMVVRGDGTIVKQGVAGVRKRGDEAKMEIGDLIHLGSCTKSMTATMIGTLVDEGKMSWGTTIGEVFPDVEMHPDWKDVTVALLLTMKSGAPQSLDQDGLWGKLWQLSKEDPVKQRRALVAGVLKNPPLHKPGTKFEYSNASFAIAGAMAEKITGTPWEELMQTRLFRPLGIRSAGFGAPGKDQPVGHTTKGVPVPGADNPAAIGPAGTVHMSFPDWAKYVAFHLDGEPKLLDRRTRDRLYEGPGYAMGWALAPRDWAGGTALTHNGSNTMWFVVVWLAPKRDFAVIVGTNQGGADKATDEAAWAFIQDYLKK